MFVRSNNKTELIDETRLEIKKGLNINFPTNLITRVVNDRAITIKKSIELKVPRIIIGGIGSFVIKQGKNRFPIKKGREYYVRKLSVNDSKLNPRLLIKFKLTGDDKEEEL